MCLICKICNVSKLCKPNQTKPNLLNQIYQTKSTKPNLPNQTHQTKTTKLNLLVKAVNAWFPSKLPCCYSQCICLWSSSEIHGRQSKGVNG